MPRIKASWWTLILTLFVLLMAPAHANADFWQWYSPSGDSDPSGDPDHPMGPGIAPGVRAGGVRGDVGYQKPRVVQTDRGWMGRYLTLLSGLRSYYLRF